MLHIECNHYEKLNRELNRETKIKCLLEMLLNVIKYSQTRQIITSICRYAGAYGHGRRPIKSPTTTKRTYNYGHQSSPTPSASRLALALSATTGCAAVLRQVSKPSPAKSAHQVFPHPLSSLSCCARASSQAIWLFDACSKDYPSTRFTPGGGG
jgi:hypothetical protein